MTHLRNEMPNTVHQVGIQAAFRDASFLRNPDTRSVKMAHVLRADGSASCGMLALMGDPEPAELVEALLRCKRAGCRQRWPSPTMEANAEPVTKGI